MNCGPTGSPDRISNGTTAEDDLAIVVVSWNIAKRYEPWRQLLQMDANIATGRQSRFHPMWLMKSTQARWSTGIHTYGTRCQQSRETVELQNEQAVESIEQSQRRLTLGFSTMRTASPVALLILAVLLGVACAPTNYEVMSIDERRAEVQKLRAELEALPEDISINDTRELRLHRSLSDRLGGAIPTEDISYDKISCREVNAIQRAEVRRMRQKDPDVADSAIEASERYAKAERVRVECRENAPTPTAVPIQIRVTAEQLAAAYAANEVAADRTYKNKYAEILGAVETVGAGTEIRISAESSVTLFAYVLIHPEIPCFVDEPDSLAPLVQGHRITVEGRIMGYRTLQVEGLLPARIIDVLSCSIKVE